MTRLRPFIEAALQGLALALGVLALAAILKAPLTPGGAIGSYITLMVFSYAGHLTANRKGGQAR